MVGDRCHWHKPPLDFFTSRTENKTSHRGVNKLLYISKVWKNDIVSINPTWYTSKEREKKKDRGCPSCTLRTTTEKN